MNTTTNALRNHQDLPAITDSQAKEYDYILLVDQSGSMGDDSDKMKGRTRWEEAEEFTTAFARYADKHDDDGITVISFSSHATVNDGVHADAVTQIFKTHTPGGSTNLAAALEEAFKKKWSSSKPAYVLVLTDGIPDSEEEVVRSIIAASKKIENGDQLGVQFIQIGSDKRASEFLNRLDEGLERKGAKFDIVNALTREQAENMTFEQMIWAAFND